jgi:hypothetical protein
MRTYLSESKGGQPRSLILAPRVGAVLIAVAAACALLIYAGSASANNDPHRVFLPSAPIDFPSGFCGFPVHEEATKNKEYGKVSTGPDGSTITVLTGSLFAAFTNTQTGKSITVNVSGPATQTVSGDGSILTSDGTGLSGVFGTNLTRFGFPSNIVVTSGPINWTLDLTTFTVASVTGHPHVLVDVCAALSP